MEQDNLLFYNEYEQFYEMAQSSEAFRHFCEEAFGNDFSQDGFSDTSQVNRILQYIPTDRQARILDIGCGNSKMLGYLQKKTGAYIYGFDYSQNAIDTARATFKTDSDFKQACIGEIDYPAGTFDVIVSMDTMYFAPDMAAFTDQIMKWLKKGGTFFTCYQEGDVVPKTENADTSQLAQILRHKSIHYDCTDITRESYDLLLRKKKAAISLKYEFEREGNGDWCDMLIAQTEYADRPFEEYRKELARYVYVVRKNK